MNDYSVPMTTIERRKGILCLALHLFILPYAIPRLNALLSNPLSVSAVNFLFYFVSFLCIVVLLFSCLRRSLTPAFTGIHRTLRVAFFAYIILQASTVLLSMLIRCFLPQFSNVNDQSIAMLLEENYGLIALATVFLVPVTEETLYRGLVFGSLCPYRKVLAYTVSAVVFAAIHVVGYLGVYPGIHLLLCFLQYLPAGLTLAWAYHASGTLAAPILVHMTINAIGLYQLR